MGIDDKRFTGLGRDRLIAMIEELEAKLKDALATAHTLQEENSNLQQGIGLTGIYLKGFHCRACGAFNGDEKERRSDCRSCGLAR